MFIKCNSLSSGTVTISIDGSNDAVNIEEYQIENKDETIYDLQGRILNEIPKSGFYIKGGKKYCVIK